MGGIVAAVVAGDAAVEFMTQENSMDVRHLQLERSIPFLDQRDCKFQRRLSVVRK